MENKAVEQVLELDPAVILADDNSRYDLKQTRIDSLAESITEQGGVIEPVEVEALMPAVNGHLYRLTMGFYRHAAVLKLNGEGAGLSLPAIVRDLGGDSVQRLKRQLAENVERENQTPMDRATAIQKLIDAEVPVIEIRKIFSVTGGRKGMKTQPASNSYINMMKSFLDFPAKIQEKIHDGRIPVVAAYELRKAPKEKWDNILERVEADAKKDAEREEAEEKKELEKAAKSAEQEAKQVEFEKNKAEIDTELAEAAHAASATMDRIAELAKSAKTLKDKEARKKAAEELKSAENDSREATKRLGEAEKEKEKLDKQLARQTTLAKAREAKMKEAKSKKAAKPEGAVSPSAVKKAVAQEAGGAVPLKLAEIRDGIHTLTLEGSHEKVKPIGNALQRWITGVTTEGQMYDALLAIVGAPLRKKGR